jgi:general L-amino acid transport system permease protein
VKKDPAITTDAELLPSDVPFLRDPEKRAIVFQVIALLLVAVVSYYLYSNTQANLERQSIATGFGFLEKEASFEIGESVIEYSAADSYADALLVGALNTVKVSFIGIIFTLVLGTLRCPTLQQLAGVENCRGLHRSDAEHSRVAATLLLVRNFL